MNNPYPKMIVDECSGIEVTSRDHEVYQMGFDAGRMGLTSQHLRLLVTALSLLPMSQVDVGTWRFIHGRLLKAMME